MKLSRVSFCSVSQSLTVCESRAVNWSTVTWSRSLSTPYQVLRGTPYSVMGRPTVRPGSVTTGTPASVALSYS